MILRKALLCSFTVLVGLTACNTGQNTLKDANGITHINMVSSHEISNGTQLAKVGKKVEYIPLEYTDECAVADVYKLFPAKDFYLILTPDELLRFGKDGKFLGKIGKKGNGPGEFVVIVDCVVDEEKELIYGLDMMKNRLLCYKFDGTYEKEVPISHFCLQFCKLPGDKFAVSPVNFNGDRESKLVVVNNQGDTLQHFYNPVRYKRESMPVMIDDQNSYKEFGDQVRFHQIFNDTIFSLTPQMALNPMYIMDCGKFKMPLDVVASYEKWEKTGKNYYLVDNVQESEHQLFIRYKYNDKYHRCVYNKDNGDLAHLNQRDSLGIPNNLDNGLPFWPMVVRNNKEMMTLWPAFKLKAEVKRMKEKGVKISEELRKLDETMKISDNPVIQVVREI
ncbi:MAG: 6-bladed beta-propeller [Marinifilaceae bacterium]